MKKNPEIEPISPEIRLNVLKKASWAGIIGNLLLSALKITAGLVSSSLAVVGDGIDSLSDVVTSMVTLYAAKAGAAPPDPEHPWGHGRAETIATKTLSLVIIMAGLQLLTMTVRKITGAEISNIPGKFALLASGISIIGKSALAAYKFHAGRITESQMMHADAINMRNDILLSFVVLTGVFFTRILNLPILDIAAGFAVSIWIIISGIRVFLHTNTELMDSIDDKNVYCHVFQAAEMIQGISNPHRVRIRGLNSLYVIDMDVEVDGNLSVSEAHSLACSLEVEIRNRINKVYDIMVHIEPAGVPDHLEGYGLVPDDIRRNRSNSNK
ncbi:MAG: cation transporter [Spirochaetes bacterium]|nr:MAG: cation transporter [Spirochaetota bacterium]